MESKNFALDAAAEEQKEVDERIERLDTKTGVIFGFVVVSVAEILGFLLLIAGENHKLDIAHRCWFVGLFAFALACVVVTTVLGCWEMLPRRTHVGFF
jgi:hypothetical protein